jgi:hypothetical protein
LKLDIVRLRPIEWLANRRMASQFGENRASGNQPDLLNGGLPSAKAVRGQRKSILPSLGWRPEKLDLIPKLPQTIRQNFLYHV